MSFELHTTAGERLTELIEYHAALVKGAASLEDEIPDEMAADGEQLSAPLRALERLRRNLPPSATQTEVETAGDTAPRRLGRFEILEEMGYGSYGVVYRAHDPLLDRDVALKVPRPETLLFPARRRRFLRESRALASLRHPNLVTVFEFQELGPACYIASELCQGPTLAQWLNEQPRPAPPRLAAAVVARLAEATEYVHSHGILHRDIKPSNVLLQPRSATSMEPNEPPFIPKLADFGLAKLPDDSGAATTDGTILGTPQYMAPEQAAGRVEAVTPATDVYGLGALLYEMLTGEPPVTGSTDVEALRHAAEGRISLNRQFCRHVSAELQAICLKCLEFDPSRRYASAELLAADLDRFLCHRPILARRAGPIARLTKWWRRSPLMAGLALLLALSLAAGAGAGAWQWSRAENFRHKSDAQLDQAHQQVLHLQELLDRGDNFDAPHFRPLRLQVALANLGRLRELAAQRPHDMKLRANLAECWYQVAELQFRGQQSTDARQSYEQSLPLWDELCRCRPTEAESLLRLAQTFHRLGHLCAAAGCSSQAAALFDRSLAVHRSLDQALIADVRFKRNESEVYTEIARLHTQQEEFCKAGDALADARRVLLELQAAHPSSTLLLRRLALNWHETGWVLHRLARLEEALACEQQAAEAIDALLRGERASAEDLKTAAQIYHFRGKLLSAVNQPDAATDALRRAVALFDDLILSEPADVRAQISRGGSIRWLARCESARGRLDLAERLYQNGCARLEEAVRHHPGDGEVRKALAALYDSQGTFLHNKKEFDEARRRYEQALELLRSRDADSTSSESRDGFLASVEQRLRRLNASQAEHIGHETASESAAPTSPPRLIGNELND
jgi:tetratricopeptide (TPR) repeat protein/tRNA A-37 threonylcarbamoyl transferase component Bud32